MYPLRHTNIIQFEALRQSSQLFQLKKVFPNRIFGSKRSQNCVSGNPVLIFAIAFKIEIAAIIYLLDSLYASLYFVVLAELVM